MDNRPVGIFDSGFGGLTALKALREMMPDENIIYFGDNGRAPYGGRGAEQLQAMLVGTVNALNSQRSGIPQEIDLRLKTDDGQTMGRWLVPFVRSEDRSNPEVVSDT